MTPVVETERLILRGRTLADFPAYAALWADPAVVRFIGGAPLSEEDAWGKFVRMDGLWSLCGYGFWIIEEKTESGAIGELGFADFKRAIEPSLDGMPEFGWMLAPSAQGKGYAKEALAAALSWGERKFPEATFSCIIDPVNAPSIRVAEAAGFRRVAIGQYKGAEIGVYHRAPRPL